jgi:hypothetical protein
MVTTQIILLSSWFNKKNQPKRPSQNNCVQINLSKMAFWSRWTWGQKTHMEGFLTKIPIKKIVIFCRADV